MRRAAGFVLVLALLTGGAAACGSSGGSSGGDTKTTEGSSNTDSSDADVQAYCKAVDEFVAKAKEILADPTKGDATSLQSEGQELTAKATELAKKDLSSEDAQAVADCSKKSTDALLPG